MAAQSTLRVGDRVVVDLFRGGRDIDTSIHAGDQLVRKVGTVTTLIGSCDAGVTFDDGDYQVTHSAIGTYPDGYPVTNIARA